MRTDHQKWTQRRRPERRGGRHVARMASGPLEWTSKDESERQYQPQLRNEEGGPHHPLRVGKRVGSLPPLGAGHQWQQQEATKPQGPENQGANPERKETEWEEEMLGEGQEKRRREKVGEKEK